MFKYLIGPFPDELGNDDCAVDREEAILRREKVLQGDHPEGHFTEAACFRLLMSLRCAWL